MKILAIYPNEQGYGRLPLGLALLITILQEKGHEVELFDTTFISRSDNIDNAVREKAKLVIPIDKSNLYDFKTHEEIDGIFKAKVASFCPDLVMVSILEENYSSADRLLSLVKELDSSITVIVGGSTPTIAPQVIMENPHINYLIQGEGEEALTEFCDCMEKGLPIKNIRNLWFKEDGKIYSNSLRPFVKMDTLPIINFDIWDDRHFFKPYNGRMYRAGYFEISRGCLNKCTYCINEAYQKVFSEAGSYHRQKSIENVITEMKTLKEHKNIELILFCDDNFLMMSETRINKFAKLYKQEINLPYWINTAPESINSNRLTILKDTGCCGIGMGIETGSEWLRKNVLKRKTTNDTLKRAFDLIHKFGIRTTANNMIGFPGECEADFFDTIRLNREIRPDSCDLNFVSPYIGTVIHEISTKLGYIDVFDKPGFKGMAKEVSSRLGPVIHNPCISKERLVDLYYKFMDYVNGRIDLPIDSTLPAKGDNDGGPSSDELIRVIDVMNNHHS